MIALLGGCATTPAPVVDRSLGSETNAQSPQTPTTMQSLRAGGSAQHANGSMTAQGYVVARGDTLYSVAFKHGMDFRALAARNGIGPPYTIHPGQVLGLGNGVETAHNAGARTAIGTASAVPPAHGAPPNPSSVFGPVETVPLATAAHAPNNTTLSGTVPASSSGITILPQVDLAQGNTPAMNRPSPNVNQLPVAPPAANESKPLPAMAAGKTRNVDGIVWQWPADGAVISGFQAGSGAGLDIAGNAGDPVRAAADGVVVYSGNGLIGYGELIIIKHSDNYLSAYGHNRQRLVKEGEHVRAGQLIAAMGSSGAPREELHFEIRREGKPVDPNDYLPAR